AQARRATVDWLQAYGTVAWPHAAAPGGGFDWNRLHVGASGAAASGEARLDQQYLRANVEPSERYVLAPPVLNRLRLPPDRSGFDNLVLAGDWTRTAVNAGCVEAAVMSGMAASRALCGYPSSIFGERFLSPERATPAIPAPAGNPGRRVEVTILGGGCAAMSTAFWLTSTEELRRRYKVTVYTQSWRLGGKGASGRDENNRIEEHGLHVMLGFYATVFRTMERCYDELAACKEFTALDKPAFRSWHEALTPQTEFMLWLRWPPAPDQPLVPWPVSFPQPLVAAGEFPDPVGVVAAIGAWLRTASVGLQEALRPALLLAGWAAERIESLAAPAVALYSLLLQPLSDRFSELAHDIGQLHLQIERQLADLGGMGAAIAHGVHAVEDGVRQDLYKLQLIQSCGLALARGLVEDVILGPGFDALNHLDFKDWLRSHGATPEAATCPLVMAFYDLAFAYPDGDSSRPENGRAAAGAALRLILRMLFGYSGAPAYKMRASMGETIFTPLYLVLKKRGVDFRFLSRVDKLSLSPDHSRIGSVTFRQSPELHAHYDPLIDVTFDDGSRWPCWPNQARAPRAAAGAEDPWGPPQGEGPQLTLAIGKEDKVVLAIPPAAAAHLTAELTRWTPGWREMLAGARSVATLSQQLWYEQTSAELGHRPVIATGFADPLRSWGDMSQVLHAEPQVPGNVAVRSCHYLCGTYAPPAGEPLPTPGPRPGYLEGQQAHAAAQAQQWMQKWAAALWPGVAPERLLAPVHAYSQLNLAHSEQYVLSLPGTIASRLAPGGSGCANLYLAGDWTRTSIDGSCAEAAFESGLQAAAAICGIPARTLLEGL
ncbi:MAG: FAD-dependent oxidoreductase, partial [Nevskia sp.]|nr:FAD-dependent oxidoreductase [Nevskia sp.]